ncbi:MAG: hypothetical protein K9L62_10480 [Vallitaleaceae bacterium]|nr:hypothetical protein [Vallitaleaceae bacterium]
MKPKIGIIGFGFLGRALAHGFVLHADIKIYDKYQDEFNSLEETVNTSDFIFVGVPTPMADDGSQDLSNIYDAVKNVDEVAIESKTIIIRSTVIPGTTRKVAEEYPRHNFVFFPEFLTERTAKLDFINASRLIFGGDPLSTKKVENLFRERFPHTPIFKTTWEASEMVKYMSNCFFAIKISFLNEIYDIAEYAGVPYEELRNMWLSDYRIGNSHTDVPGHDGDRGYGGKCFPKDVKAFVKWAEEQNVNMDMCRAADAVNERIRKKKDWFNIKGATTKNGYGDEE